MYFTKFTAQNYVCSGHFEEEYFDYSGRLQDKLDIQGSCADRHVKSKLMRTHQLNLQYPQNVKNTQDERSVFKGEGFSKRKFAELKKKIDYVSLSVCNWKGLFS